MCRGVVRGGGGGGEGGGRCNLSKRRKVEAVPCRLCGSRAILYCQADGAYLCRKCDGQVHGANFLAGRHVRCLLCNRCQKLTQRYVVGYSTDATMNLTRTSTLIQEDDCSQAAPERPFMFL